MNSSRKIVPLLLLILVLITSCNTNSMEKTKDIHLKIFETTDVHGALFPMDLLNKQPRQGSLAQVFTYLKKERSADAESVILLDNGDLLQGDPSMYFYNYEMQDSVHLLSQIMNIMDYDAATIGNHDIEAGHAVYDKFVKEINFPWLAANAIQKKDSTPYFKPYTILERKGIRIAVLGMVTPSIPKWLPESLWEGMYFDDIISSSKYWMEHLKTHENPDLIIGLFHSGLENDRRPSAKHLPAENASLMVAQEVSGFDIIFAGHDHQTANLLVENPSGDSTLVLNAGPYASHLALADIHLRYNANSKKYEAHKKGQIISMEGVKADSSFLYAFNVSHEKVKRYIQRIVGKNTHKVEASAALFGSSAFVDLIHEAQLDITQADVSLAAPFSLNTSIEKGDIRMADLFKLYRFENFLYVMKLNGKEIKDILEYAYDLWITTMQKETDPMIKVKRDEHGKVIFGRSGKALLANPYYNFDSGGGIRYTVDLRKEAGKRIQIEGLINGKAFHADSSYKVAMNSYRANGGGDLLTLGAGIDTKDLENRILWASERDFRMLLMHWIEKKKIIHPKAKHEWKFIPQSYAEKGVLTYLKGI